MNLSSWPTPRREAARRPIDAGWQELGRPRTLPMAVRAAWRLPIKREYPLGASQPLVLRQVSLRPCAILDPADCYLATPAIPRLPPQARLLQAGLPLPPSRSKFRRARSRLERSDL